MDSARVLVVDDRQAVHDDFRAILTPARPASEVDELEHFIFGTRAPSTPQHARFLVDSALQGQQAFHMARQAVQEGEPYALAFVDMRMPPGWDGAQTVRALWQIDPRLEIVICTAYSDHDWSEIAALAGSSDQLLVLKKPFDPLEVRQLARTLARKRVLRRSAEMILQELETRVAARTAALQSATAELARRAAEREQVLQHIQLLMCPGSLPAHPGGCDVVGFARPAESCGGDWWACASLAGDRLLLAIGDVTGHGPPAAVVAASARGAFAALVQRGVEPSPARLLTSLDRAVRGIARGGWLMTCFAALIEPRAGAVQFANAGHPQPYILPAAGGLFVPTVRGTPLGEDKLRFEEGCASVHPGDVLVFRTDGLEDAVSGSGERFGVRRIRRSLLSLGQAPGSAVEVRDTILRTLAQHMGGTPPPDDQTLVVCRVRDALPAPVIA